MNKVYLAVFSTIGLIGFATLIAIVLARGYLPDLSTRSLLPTGILVTTSDPDGARVYINDKLTTATNNTINLIPGNYDIRIEKEGFSSWIKKVEIKKEEVIKTNAFLFPKVAELSPLTLTGALNPSQSFDQRKIAYAVASSSAEKNGIWVLDMDAGRVLIGGFNSRQVFKDSEALKLGGANFIWSPDNSQILAFFGDKPKEDTSSSSANFYQGINTGSITKAYLLDTGQLNSNLLPLTLHGVDLLLSSWKDLWQEKNTIILSKLNNKISPTIKESTTRLSLSTDETKLLYTATTAAVLPTLIARYLPGTNPTPQVREIKRGGVYVYDVTEDRNYFIIDINVSKGYVIDWFPSSRHLISHNDREIAVMEYD